MTSDILTSFQLDRDFESCKIILVKEINGCDSSFITSCVLGHSVKNKHATFVISMHNSLQHYQNVGLKMNYNIQKVIESGLICFYDAGNYLMDLILQNKPLLHQELWSNIQNKLKEFHKNFDTVNIIFDGVSHLLDLNLSLRHVNEISKNLINFVRSYNNSFLLLQCNVSSEEDETYILANLLAHKAQIVAEVENLSTGLSSDVSGHITIKYLYQKFENEHALSLEPKSTQYLFKLFDRGVKLLAPGAV